MYKIKVLSANYMFWLLIVLIDISTTSYAGEFKNHINGKYDAGGIKVHIECYGVALLFNPVLMVMALKMSGGL